MKLLIILFVGFITFNVNAQIAEFNEYVTEKQPLNLDDKADAYSWLSKDGLRIYFSRDNSEDEIWMSERKSLNEEFSNPKTIGIEGITGGSEVFSCWLTDDEKTIFFVTRQNKVGYITQLFKASFSVERQCFINPIQINLQKEGVSEFSRIFISAPSLTADLKQLFVYYSGEGEHIAIFTSNDGINYEFKNFVNDGENYCPGNLSSNGLEYYLSIRDEEKLLVKLTRPNLESDFGNPQYYKLSTIHNDGISFYQPSVNTDLGILSLTFGKGTWDSNNLMIMNLPNDKVNYKDEKLIVNDYLDTLFDTNFELTTTPEFALVDTIANYEIEKVNFTGPLSEFKNDSIFFPICSFCNLIVQADTITDVEPVNEFYFQEPTPISNKIAQVTNFQGSPNPANINFSIAYNLGTYLEEKPTLEFLNMSGQVIKKYKLETTSGQIELNVEEFAQGLYYYRIYTSQFVTETKKLVIKR